jgi:hypothetical protein
MSSSFQIIRHAAGELDVAALVALWNEAFADELATSTRLLDWYCHAPAERKATVFVAERADKLMGYGFTSAAGTCGYIDAVVAPASPNRRAMVTGIVAACEAELKALGCLSVTLGFGPSSLVRGIRVDRRARRGWARRGYENAAPTTVWDVACDVGRYRPPALEAFVGVATAAQAADIDEIEHLLAAPERLRVAATDQVASAVDLMPVRRHLDDGGRLSDLMLLRTPRGAKGLCQIVFEDSPTPVDLAYPWELPRRWAMLGPIVVRDELPDSPFDLLVDASLRRLLNTGVNSAMVTGVTWTHFFSRFGFAPMRGWMPLAKALV